jgi:hypothetical protein
MGGSSRQRLSEARIRSGCNIKIDIDQLVSNRGLFDEAEDVRATYSPVSLGCLDPIARSQRSSSAQYPTLSDKVVPRSLSKAAGKLQQWQAVFFFSTGPYFMTGRIQFYSI